MTKQGRRASSPPSATGAPSWQVRQMRDPLNWLALAVALVWAGVGIWLRPIGDYGVETDFYGDFVPNARLWMQGEPGLMKGFRGPLYYLILGAGDRLMDAFLFAKLLSAACAGAVVRLLGGLLRRFFDPTWAAGGSLFLAGNAVFMAYAYRAGTDLVYFVLFAATLALLFRRDNIRPQTWLAAGAMAGLAYLTRYNGMALVPIGIATTLITLRPIKRGGLAAAVFLAAWLVVTLPWLLLLWQKTGNPFWNRAFTLIAEDIYAQNAAQANTWHLVDRVGFRSLLDVALVDPGRFFGAMVGNLGGHVRLDVLKLVHPVWAAACGLGFAITWRTWRKRPRAAFGLAGLLAYLVLAPVFYNERFMLTLLIWWSIGFGGLVATATGWLAARLDRRRGPLAVRVGLGVVVLVVGLATADGVRQARTPDEAAEMPRILLDLADAVQTSGRTLDATTPICTRKPHIGYYLGAPTVRAGLGQGTEALARRGMHYLLVSDIEVRFHPQLKQLVSAAAADRPVPGLDLVAQVTRPAPDGRQRQAALFAVQDPQPWQPPPTDRVQPPEPPPPGLGPIDFMRVKLARWYLLWSPDEPLQPVFDLMTSRARSHPLVRVIEGDALIAEQEPGAAGRIFVQELNRQPRHPDLRLRLALVRKLLGDEAEFESLIQNFLGTLDTAAVGEDRALIAAAMGYYRNTDYFAAAPLFWYVEQRVDPDEHPELLRHLGLCFLSIRQTERARLRLERYLARVPDDREIEAVLQRDTRLETGRD